MLNQTDIYNVGEKETAQQVQVDAGDLELSLREDGETFINFFLNDALTFAVPPFHLTCWEWLCNIYTRRIVLALPRGHAKTTLAKLSVVWHFLFTDIRFIVYVSNTAPIAKDALRDIVAFLECTNFVSLFGQVRWLKKSEGDGIYIFMLRGKMCVLRSLGAGQQVRGLNIDNQRPQVFIVDDLEDEENTGTEAQRIKLKRWVYGPFLKALDKRWNKVIWLGNMISVDCILRGLCDSPQWNSMLFGAILESGDPLWPDLWSIEDLIADFKEYQRERQTSVWFAEMMNMPVPLGAQLIDPDDIKYHELRYPDDITCGCITIDPALGASMQADDVGIVVHAIVNGVPEQVDYKFGIMDPTTTAEVALELCYKWGINIIGIENAAYQMALKDIFELICTMRGIENMEFLPLRFGGKKTERIHSFWSLNMNGEYSICETASDIVAQTLMFDMSRTDNKDDLIDSLAYGPQMMQEYLPLMMQTFAQNIASQKIQTGTEVCSL